MRKVAMKTWVDEGTSTPVWRVLWWLSLHTRNQLTVGYYKGEGVPCTVTAAVWRYIHGICQLHSLTEVNKIFRMRMTREDCHWRIEMLAICKIDNRSIWKMDKLYILGNENHNHESMNSLEHSCARQTNHIVVNQWNFLHTSRHFQTLTYPLRVDRRDNLLLCTRRAPLQYCRGLADCGGSEATGPHQSSQLTV